MSKYDIRVCKCGKIHATPKSKIVEAVEKDKSLLLICASCGNATVIAADRETDHYGNTRYDMLSYRFAPYTSTSITKTDFDRQEGKTEFNEILYSHGYKVPMNTGNYANDFFAGKFTDTTGPELDKLLRNDVTAEAVAEFVKNHTEESTTVDMNRFIRETPEDVLDELSNYAYQCFNWKGSKFKKKWN